MNIDTVWDALRGILDPEAGLNLVELGLIRSVEMDGEAVRLRMTLTSPGCPMGQSLVDGVRAALWAHGAAVEPVIELVWDPPWSPDDIAPDARAALERG